MVKAVFFDIDGTLISFDTHKIPASAISALQKLRQNGIKVFLSTGRIPMDIDSVLGDLVNLFDGFVALNGQYCFDKDGRVLHQQPIDKGDLDILVHHLENTDIACGFLELDYYYFNKITQAIHKTNEYLGNTVTMRPVDDVQRIYSHPVYQLNIFLPESEEAAFMKLLPNCKSARWCPYFADIIPKSGGKATGIAHVLEHYGIDVKDTMSFGDGGNDIEMLRFTAVGIAMGNAGDNVKAAADYVTGSVDDDGIANALKHFKLID